MTKSNEPTIDEQAEAFKALKRGEWYRVQWWSSASDQWKPVEVCGVHCNYTIRLKPTPKPPTYRPWTAEEVPVGSLWIKHKSRFVGAKALIIVVTDIYVNCREFGNIGYADLCGNFEQLDGTPCGVITEGEK